MFDMIFRTATYKRIGTRQLREIISNCDFDGLSLNDLQDILCDIALMIDEDYIKVFEKYQKDYIPFLDYTPFKQQSWDTYVYRAKWAAGYFDKDKDAFKDFLFDLMVYISATCEKFSDLFSYYGGDALDTLSRNAWFRIPRLYEKDVYYIFDKWGVSY